jgi:outer membrane protein assembly factor BamB
MRRYLLVAAVTATATLTGSAAASDVPAGAVVQGGRTAPGSQLWLSHFRAGANARPDAMAVSPHGGTVFVSGERHFGRAGAGYQTVAYRATTGRQLWASRYHSPGKSQDSPDAMAVSPNGAIVFVTGNSDHQENDFDYATVAYNAATGKQLWASRYLGPGDELAFAHAVAVNPDGSIVYVTGSAAASGSTGITDDAYTTIAYNAATGRQLWVSRYHSPGKAVGTAESVAVSPDGGRVFVTGTILSRTDASIYATVAYNAATGKQLWATRYHVGISFNGGQSVAVSPDGATVFTAGTSNSSDFATIAYQAATGKQLWISHYRGPGRETDLALSMAVSPAGSTIFVTGVGNGSMNGDNYVTVAYNAATGKQLWTHHSHGNQAQSIAVNPHGTAVYVTGDGSGHAGFLTFAYNAATGKQLWTRGYGTAGKDGADLIVASPDGTAVFVTGSAGGEHLTIAYRS